MFDCFLFPAFEVFESEAPEEEAERRRLIDVNSVVGEVPAHVREKWNGARSRQQHSAEPEIRPTDRPPGLSTAGTILDWLRGPLTAQTQLETPSAEEGHTFKLKYYIEYQYIKLQKAQGWCQRPLVIEVAFFFFTTH